MLKDTVIKLLTILIDDFKLFVERNKLFISLDETLFSKPSKVLFFILLYKWLASKEINIIINAIDM